MPADCFMPFGGKKIKKPRKKRGGERFGIAAESRGKDRGGKGCLGKLGHSMYLERATSVNRGK